MKSKLSIFFLFICLISADLAFASFPVARTASTTTATTISVDTEETSTALYSPAASSYNKWIAVALWFFLGGLAAHRWYAGKPTGWNILFILTLGGLGIWAIVDLINILTDNFKD